MPEGYNGLPAYYGQSSNPMTPNVGFALLGMDPIVAENFVLADAAIGSGGSTPGGPTNSIQYNTGSALGGLSSFYLNPVNGQVTVIDTSSISTNLAGFTVKGNTQQDDIQDWYTSARVIGDGPDACYVQYDGTFVAITGIRIIGTLIDGTNTVGVSGQILSTTGTGTLWVDAGSGFTNPMTTLGDTIYEDATPTAVRLAGNTTTIKQYLSQTGDGVNSAAPAWAQIAAADLSDGTTGTGAIVLASAISGFGSGTVTSFSAGALSPLFTTSVATSTTTPALSFSLSNAAQNAFLAGPTVGGAGAPAYRAIVAGDVPTLPYIATSLMTTLGDIIYENATPAAARLAGNTTTARQFLISQGSGSAAAAPAWGALTSGDIPNNAANTSGTAANLSGTPALPNGTAGTTQSAGDNSTKLATDAFVLGQGFVTASTLPNSTAPTTTFPTGITSMVAVGDSITLGFGIPQATQTTASLQCYAKLFADMLNLPLTSNLSVSGTGVSGSGYATQAYSLTPTSAVGTVGLFGANDITFVIAAAANQTVYQNALTAIITWLALPAGNRVLDASISYSGGWSSFSEFGLSGHYSSTSGNTATATVSGTTVYVAGWTSGSYGSLDISVDSVSKGNFVLAPAGNTMASAIYPYCFRVSGLSAGSHTVVATNHASTDVAIQWFGGNNGIGATSPLVAMGNTIPRTGFTSGNITTMNTVMATVISNLVADSLNVVGILDSAVLSTTASPAVYQADNIHPNMYGHSLLAKCFYETFCPTATFPTTISVGGDDLAQVLNTPGLTPSLVGSFIEGLANFWASKDEPGSFASIDINGNLTNTLLNKITYYNSIATVSNGIPSELAVKDLTAQSAAITATTLYAPTATGMYRVSWSADITTASDGSSVLGGTNGFQVLYTSPTDSVVKTTVAGNSVTSAANTTGTALGGSLVVYAKTGTNIQFTYGYTSVQTTTAMAYELHIKVEAL